jgi:hypothetical protein
MNDIEHIKSHDWYKMRTCRTSYYTTILNCPSIISIMARPYTFFENLKHRIKEQPVVAGGN